VNHGFKFCVVAIGAMLAMGNRVHAQCFLCSDLSGNTSVGTSALKTQSGANNVAVGFQSLYSNGAGKGNAAQGVNALYSNTSGIRNLGIGSNALYDNTTGSYNVALGFDAGYNQTSGNDNIYLNNEGVSGESQTLRLGTQGTSGVVGSGILTAYVAGVATSQVTGSAVYVTSSGQLGVLASSERFKTEVETMQDASSKLAQLRPVTFKLKTDPQGKMQYGLIAEEVAKVYPDLVIHGADGRIDGVRYEELSPLLLNVVQQQQVKLAEQDDRNAEQAAQIRDLQRQLADLRDLKRQVAELRELASPAKAEKVKARVRTTT
jgi:trimeric autotransporter adhesin